MAKRGRGSTVGRLVQGRCDQGKIRKFLKGKRKGGLRERKVCFVYQRKSDDVNAVEIPKGMGFSQGPVWKKKKRRGKGGRGSKVFHFLSLEY